MRARFPLNASIFAETGLTPRESEVACWLIEGKTNAEIALLMKLQIQTVKAHVTALFNKTGIGNRLALTLHLMELVRALPQACEEIRTFPVKNCIPPARPRD